MSKMSCDLSGDLPGDLRPGGEGGSVAGEQGERLNSEALLPGALPRLQRRLCGAGEELRGGGSETGAAHGEQCGSTKSLSCRLI